MSWSIEEHIGDCRPFPAQVVVYRGETDECLAYVSGEVADRLKAENAKLRELAEDAMKSACTGCPHKKAWRSCEGCNLYEQATKLGIEVES